MANDDVKAILVGGPCDRAIVTGPAGLMEQTIDGLVHRYIVTTKAVERDGETLPLYNYDGEVDPEGAMPGAETPTRRMSTRETDQ
jgi:hypothetical protein